MSKTQVIICQHCTHPNLSGGNIVCKGRNCVADYNMVNGYCPACRGEGETPEESELGLESDPELVRGIPSPGLRELPQLGPDDPAPPQKRHWQTQIQEGLEALLQLQDSIHVGGEGLTLDRCFADIEITRYALALTCESSELAEALGVLPWREPAPVREARSAKLLDDVVLEAVDVLLFLTVVLRHVNARLLQLNEPGVAELVAHGLVYKADVVRDKLVRRGFTPELLVNAIKDNKRI